MTNGEQHKLNAIVGCAIRAMVESGADDATVGAFAASHREQISRILGISEQPAEPPDLLSMVTQAVEQALANGGGVNKTDLKRSKQKVYVKVNGRRTSLTLRTDSLSKLIDSVGSAKKANLTIQSLVTSSPPDVDNRSEWVDERLAAMLTASMAEPSEARH